MAHHWSSDLPYNNKDKSLWVKLAVFLLLDNQEQTNCLFPAVHFRGKASTLQTVLNIILDFYI